MISSLWTLCQTCPSVGAGQLRLDGRPRTAGGNKQQEHWWTSEGYRDIETATRVIEHAPKPSSGRSLVYESTATSHKDVADVQLAQQAHQQCWTSGRNTWMEPSAIPAYLRTDNQAFLQVLRRSQSEGPSTAAAQQPIDSLLPGGSTGGLEIQSSTSSTGRMAAWVGRRRHLTEHQKPENWFAPASSAQPSVAASPPIVQQEQPSKRLTNYHKESAASAPNKNSEYQLQFNWPAGKSSYGHRGKMPESMDSVLHNRPVEEVPVTEREAAGVLSSQHRVNWTRTGDGGDDQQPMQSTNDSEDQPRRRRYKTEYKKKFRPFSLYQYVDGRFQKPEKGAGDTVSTSALHSNNDGSNDTWYREVIELRKKAGEYKYRGIGGELMSQNLADLYAKQFDVWEQVSRRSSLSALALAATSPRPLDSSKDVGGHKSLTNSKRGSPAKTASSARPGHAQPVPAAVSSFRKESNNTTRNTDDAAELRPRREMSQQQRSVSVEGKARRAKSARWIKSPSHHGPPPVSGNAALVIVRPSLGSIFHPVNRTSSRSASAGPERRMPKSNSSNNNAAGTVPSVVKVRPAHNNNDGVKGLQRNAVVDEGMKENINHQDNGPSSLPTTFIEPLSSLPITLIKALAEPTRVKSPEMSVVRSPDPVNWTVPLETGKCFTVTQNIRGGEGSRPHSELKLASNVRPPAVAATAPSVPTETVKDPVKNVIPAPINNVSAPENLPIETLADTSKMEDDEDPAAQPDDDDSNKPSDDTTVAKTEIKPALQEPQENGPILPTNEPADPLNAASVLKQEVKPANVSKVDVVEAVTSIVPGTTLRRLEDPTPFLFSSSPRPGSLDTATAPPAPKAPRYRVLEAPDPSEPVAMQSSTSMTFAASPYKVLEAPSSPPANSPSASPSSNRSIASDVLEKARTRFDRFWTKKDTEK